MTCKLYSFNNFHFRIKDLTDWLTEIPSWRGKGTQSNHMWRRGIQPLPQSKVGGQVLCCCNISVLPKFQPTRRDTCRFVNSPYIFYNLTFTPLYQYASSLCCSLNISNVTRIFLTIENFLSSHLFNLFSKPWCLIQRWYSCEKLNAHHSLGLQG